jgi:hypothetical protein
MAKGKPPMTAADTPSRELLALADELVLIAKAINHGDYIDAGVVPFTLSHAADILRLAAKPADDGVREATIEECADLIEQYGLDNLRAEKDYPATVAALLLYRIRALTKAPKP